MLSQQQLIVFYSICGVLVASLLVRMWRKNKATSHRPAAPSDTNTGRVSQPEQPRPASPSPVMAAATSVPNAPEVTMSRPTAATTYGKSSEYEYTGWEGRRLLDTAGLMPQHVDLMPRILPQDVPGTDDGDRLFGSWFNPALASLLPESDERREEARKDLMSAGYYNPYATENLAAARYVLMMGSLIFFGLLLLVVPPQLEPYVIAGCFLAPLLGWAFPALYVRGKAKERKHEIERAMPDLLDMLNMCVSQGLTVPDSLQRIGRDFRPVYPALSQELSIVNEQSKISTMQTALENFSERIDLPEVHSLTSLLIQTEKMGTSISQALTTYSDTMRESQRQQADEKGNRATFRLLFPTVLCLMPAVYLFLLGPAINELQRFFYGGGLAQLNQGTQAVQRVSNNPGQGRPRGQARPPGSQR